MFPLPEVATNGLPYLSRYSACVCVCVCAFVCVFVCVYVCVCMCVSVHRPWGYHGALARVLNPLLVSACLYVDCLYAFYVHVPCTMVRRNDYDRFLSISVI